MASWVIRLLMAGLGLTLQAAAASTGCEEPGSLSLLRADELSCATRVAEAAGPPAVEEGGTGTVYRVGPDQKFAELGDVPWFNLRAGDTVYIHYRSKPYREKILISGRGSPSRWIRVHGLPGPNGERPVISGDGATTSRNMHYRWQNPTDLQWLGVVQIAVINGPNGTMQLPGYIEIANLRIQDGYKGYRFTAENGASLEYSQFAACIYARSAQHIVIRDNVLTNCGLGFFNWTGDGSAWWSGLQTDTLLARNHFFNNGVTGSYSEHQVYTESDGVVIEGNHFGPMRTGALGSQIKDRSAGTVIRYNYIEQSPAGWDIDLVEPEESAPALLKSDKYRQAFVYANTIVNDVATEPNYIHWNEDHQSGRGRATLPDGKLLFYNNTLVDRAASSVVTIFNATWGGYDCPSAPLLGTIDIRNNIFASLPAAGRRLAGPIRFAYCGKENLEFGANWVSPAGTPHGARVRGWEGLISPAGNDPGFLGHEDFRLASGATAAVAGGALAPEVTSNVLGLDLSPINRYAHHLRIEQRPAHEAGGVRLGAY